MLHRLLALAALAVALPLAASAADTTKGGVTVTTPWSRATPGGVSVGAAYFGLVAKDGDRLVGARSAVAGTVELHEHAMSDGAMRMRRVEGVELAPGKAVAFEPGGYHVMLIDLKSRLVAGERFKLTLVFRKAGEIEVEVDIAGVGARGPGASSGSGSGSGNGGGSGSGSASGSSSGHGSGSGSGSGSTK